MACARGPPHRRVDTKGRGREGDPPRPVGRGGGGGLDGADPLPTPPSATDRPAHDGANARPMTDAARQRRPLGVREDMAPPPALPASREQAHASARGPSRAGSAARWEGGPRGCDPPPPPERDTEAATRGEGGGHTRKNLCSYPFPRSTASHLRTNRQHTGNPGRPQPTPPSVQTARFRAKHGVRIRFSGGDTAGV